MRQLQVHKAAVYKTEGALTQKCGGPLCSQPHFLRAPSQEAIVPPPPAVQRALSPERARKWGGVGCLYTERERGIEIRIVCRLWSSWSNDGCL